MISGLGRSLRRELNGPGPHLTYLTTGAILALLAFVISAVSAPMIFDRAAGMGTAILTSMKAVAINPAAMAITKSDVGNRGAEALRHLRRRNQAAIRIVSLSQRGG